MEIQLETAKAEHLEQYEEILHAGRRFQQEQGFIQWTENYPNRDTILEDIRFQRGYALLVDGAIAGYLCIDFAGESAYENIDGAWRTAGPYAVVHRLALSSDFRGRGLGDAAFRLAGELCLARESCSLRADTGFENRRMQHILVKNGFEKCGVISYQGSPRLAYEKTDLADSMQKQIALE